MYKLTRENKIENFSHNVRMHFNKSLNYFGGFMVSGITTGILYGTFQNYDFKPYIDSTKVIDVGDSVSGIFMTFVTAFVAKRVYDNFKKERKRWISFTAEVEREERDRRKIQKQNVEDHKTFKILQEEFNGNKVIDIPMTNDENSGGNGYSKTLMPR